MIKRCLITLGLFIAIIYDCRANMIESHLYFTCSRNKEYKLVVSPKFCNEDSCLTEDEIENLGGSLKEEFRYQSLIIFKKENGQYKKIRSYIVSDSLVYLNGYGYKYFISNDGRKVVLADQNSLKWTIINLEDNKIELDTYRGEEIFDLSQVEFEKCLSELAGYAAKFKGLSKVSTKVGTSLKIRLRYYDFKRKKYVLKRFKVGLIDQ